MTTATKRLINQFARLNRTERAEFFKGIENVDSEIVAYTTAGKPLTLQQYIAEINEARKEVKEGKYISDEQLEKEMLTW